MTVNSERIGEFKERLEALGGVDDDIYKVHRELGKFSFLLKQYDSEIIAGLDCYDAADVRCERTDDGTKNYIDMKARMFVAPQARKEVATALAAMDVGDASIYNQYSVNGTRWAQLSLDNDAQFQGYAATRYMLDGAPIGGGVVEVDEETLEQALQQ